MAKDMLNAIIAAEEACKKRESDARLAAEKTAQQTKKDAAALIADSEEAANNQAESELADARVKSGVMLDKAKTNALRQCESITRLAQKNRPMVIRNAAKLLLS